MSSRRLLAARHFPRPAIRPSPSPRRAFSMSDPINRNPHPDFKKVEASRPPWNEASAFRFTRTVDPDWAFGDGANRLHRQPAGSTRREHVAIDPYADGRPDAFNYKLLISAVVPRPIAFLSTRGADGRGANLAPFSYFNVVCHDPPLFVVGFSCAAEGAAVKDSLRNLVETREAVVNVIGEPFVEAANATSIDAPYGASEWAVSGLTPVHDCQTVKCARVAEAVFSVEVRLDSVKEYQSRARPGTTSGTVVVLEGTRFWVRQDALNEDQNLVDPAILRPISRLGGITYGRTTEAIELQRPKFKQDLGGQEGLDKLQDAKR
ncbi:hypothetical protein HIM_10449 [Hirsutella minnesotensis 3608]|uniref:Flavin reductase like domain-containing protein n=1 Tax=Hirsutella minnesotensis 3608 TaxID=1043627 RepID=A0A0F7ZK35_9HYPO|nr:hypothetical protein HIM_10449 [Hirsutella minnesotensis 3608]